MLNKNIRIGAIAVILCIFSVGLPNAYAFEEQEAYGPSANVIVLGQGISRSITFDLYDVIWNDYSAFHTCFIVTSGGSKLVIGVASVSSLGEGADILYGTVGFVNIQPVVGFAYGSGRSISTSVDVPETGVGILFTTIFAGISGPDFPVTMNMNFYLAP